MLSVTILKSTQPGQSSAQLSSSLSKGAEGFLLGQVRLGLHSAGVLHQRLTQQKCFLLIS